MLHLKSMRIGAMAALLVALMLSATISTATTMAAPLTAPSQPNFGPNVLIFDPSMPQSQIQAKVDAIAAQQVSNEFGTQRYALLFKPGTYGSAATPLIFQVGYYTEVAGLGKLPTDVTINGHVDVYNQCLAPDNCLALTNFWRSLSNLTINVTGGVDGCRASGDFWAVSQAAPMRRVNITGANLTLMDYCTAGPQFASGGFIADSQTGFIINGSQQQFVVRNSSIGGWSNAVWNQVFSGVSGAPAQSFPNPTYTTLAASPVTREKPFLYVDATGNYNVFVPSVRTNSVGTSWSTGSAAGSSIPIDRFYIAKPGDSALAINLELIRGKNIIFTPGVYHLNQTLLVWRPDTVILGLGMATLIPDKGNVTMAVTEGKGVMISGLIFDAGAINSPTLLWVGDVLPSHKNYQSDPTTLSDVFFRIGGPAVGKATTSLVVTSDNVILDDIWAWRADHGNGVGWTSNTADTGVVITGDNVTAYGLFVEHYQKYEVIWSGNNGTVIFFQNEMPYDPPSQAAWMSAPNVKGWAAFKLTNGVKKFNGYGMGSYSFFNQHANIFADNAFEAPTNLPAGSFHDLLTIFLDVTNGDGGILNVINNTGGSSTAANPDVPVTVVSYP